MSERHRENNDFDEHLSVPGGAPNPPPPFCCGGGAKLFCCGGGEKLFCCGEPTK